LLAKQIYHGENLRQKVQRRGVDKLNGR